MQLHTHVITVTVPEFSDGIRRASREESQQKDVHQYATAAVARVGGIVGRGSGGGGLQFIAGSRRYDRCGLGGNCEDNIREAVGKHHFQGMVAHAQSFQISGFQSQNQTARRRIIIIHGVTVHENFIPGVRIEIRIGLCVVHLIVEGECRLTRIIVWSFSIL